MIPRSSCAQAALIANIASPMGVAVSMYASDNDLKPTPQPSSFKGVDAVQDGSECPIQAGTPKECQTIGRLTHLAAVDRAHIAWRDCVLEHVTRSATLGPRRAHR